MTTSKKDSTPQDLKIAADYDPTKLVWIPNTTKFISRDQECNGKTIKDAIVTVANDGLSVPGTSLFIPHLINVTSAYHNKTPLFNGHGKSLAPRKASELYEYLTSDCMISLGIYLTKDDAGRFYVEKNFKPSLEPTKPKVPRLFGKPVLSITSPLEKCLMEDGILVDLNRKSFNRQGMPTKKSRHTEYIQGTNIYFYSPKSNSISRFWAYSDGVGLICDGVPQYSGAGLGVLVCAEGTPKK